ncbi:uncharacterized protein DUF4258 [Alteromonas sp. 76-1]|jgi:hypothetical protein|uniref:DUF4258 domain-containing protein n=1 Tax=Alteromonas sp. 76-1 TaxID=2358187 RepID=UPI000FD18447|nr:DUF4258 domain-containing protein [Alteromonas sp. 76-1]VEL97564.1 uncharacterized protein DUF4258 [Alteromonas sp. 76-1]
MYTQHALTRGQQRGIKLDVIEAVIDYGHEFYRRGGHVYLCKKKTVAAMERNGLKPQFTERCKGIYVVVEDGVVKTVAHKTTSFKF